MTVKFFDASILVALGGNSISPQGEEGNVAQQFLHTTDTMRELVNCVCRDFHHIVVTHGNGPQIGNIMLRSEVAAPVVFPLPLDTCVSDSQGGMGYMLQQVLQNVLREAGREDTVVTVLTQTVVSENDPDWLSPSKYVGRFHGAADAEALAAEHGWTMKQDSNRGWRRVVPSPAPLEIVELRAIRHLLEAGVIVIGAGGGGIPVVRDAKGFLTGVEAVVDKDLASALLARSLGIGTFVILTGVEKVALRYGKPDEAWMDRMTPKEARQHLDNGEFPPGSMGPKIRAAIDFAEHGGRVIITHPGHLEDALAGKTGTVIAQQV